MEKTLKLSRPHEADTDNPSHLAYVANADVLPLTEHDPFNGTEDELVRTFNSEEERSLVVFLGIDEKDADCEQAFTYKGFTGVPYFAIDATSRVSIAEAAKCVTATLKERGFAFFTRPKYMGYNPRDAAIYAEARTMVDWNTRNPFCSGCGQPTLSVNAGTKRVCPPADLAGGMRRERSPCATRGSISNLSFPRTDPTIIALVVSADGSRLLLGRQRQWPKYRYSALAGFLEPGESIDEAVRREVWEESGVHVGRVVVHSSQPWPFPANLMIGTVAEAMSDEIDLGIDSELEHARWFSIDEVRRALVNGASGPGESLPEEYKEGDLKIPPPTAIANQMMKAIIEGYLDMTSDI